MATAQPKTTQRAPIKARPRPNADADAAAAALAFSKAHPHTMEYLAR